MSARDYNHADADIDVSVVKHGVDMKVKSGALEIVCELTQDQALMLAHAIMYRAGARVIRHLNGDSAHFEFYDEHPFKDAWSGEPE